MKELYFSSRFSDLILYHGCAYGAGPLGSSLHATQSKCTGPNIEGGPPASGNMIYFT